MEHLIWIIPVTIIISVLIGIGFMGIGISTIADNYPVISCIMMMEDSLNVEGNKMPFTKESQREAIQWRCVKENIDFNASYQSLLEFKG